ncbi:MAG: thioredoxin domain-containing protein [Actinomycetaceae bacterium]|nr:thioredoxin domain-containing protein [Actinomycetaceae bacterium]
MASTSGSSQPKSSKQDQRAALREKARIVREQEAKRAQRNRTFTIVIAFIFVALVALAAWRILASEGAGNGANGEMGNYDGAARPVATTNVTDDGGILLDTEGGATAEESGAPVIGVWSDYMCIGCQYFEMNNGEVMQEYMAAGELQAKLYPVNTMGQQMSTEAAAALYYTAEYAPEYVWAFNTALMERGFKSTAEGQPQPSASEIADIAAELGMPEDVVNDMPASITSPEWQAMPADTVAVFRANGFRGTPTLTVDGVEDGRWLIEGGPSVVDILAEVAAG